jgi:hypothetical protein
MAALPSKNKVLVHVWQFCVIKTRREAMDVSFAYSKKGWRPWMQALPSKNTMLVHGWQIWLVKTRCEAMDGSFTK